MAIDERVAQFDREAAVSHSTLAAAAASYLQRETRPELQPDQEAQAERCCGGVGGGVVGGAGGGAGGDAGGGAGSSFAFRYILICVNRLECETERDSSR